MLIALPNHRRTAQYFALKPLPLAFLAGLLLGLFGALIVMDDNKHHRGFVNKSQRSDQKKSLHASRQKSLLKYLDDVPSRKTSHGTLKQQLVDPFTLHSQLAGISIATLQEGEIIEKHTHETMFEFFYVLQGTLLIRDISSWNECGVGCFYQGAPAQPQEFRVKHGPVQMMVFQLVTDD